MEFIKKNTGKILLAAGAAAVLFGGLYLLSETAPKKMEISDNSSIPSLNQSVVFPKNDRYLTMIEKLKPAIEANLKAGGLTKETIMGINVVVIEMFTKDYLDLVKEGRAKRRVNMDNMSQYIAAFLENSNKSEALIENVSREVLKDLGITMSQFESSSEKIMQADPNFAFQNLQMFETVKMRLPSSRNQLVSKDEVVAMIKFQAQKYQEVDINEPSIDPRHVMMVKQTYISDLASKKFGFEEEDIGRNPTIMQDPEIIQASQEMQMVLYQEQMKLQQMI